MRADAAETRARKLHAEIKANVSAYIDDAAVTHAEFTARNSAIWDRAMKCEQVYRRLSAIVRQGLP